MKIAMKDGLQETEDLVRRGGGRSFQFNRPRETKTEWGILAAADRIRPEFVSDFSSSSEEHTEVKTGQDIHWNPTKI